MLKVRKANKILHSHIRQFLFTFLIPIRVKTVAIAYAIKLGPRKIKNTIPHGAVNKARVINRRI